MKFLIYLAVLSCISCGHEDKGQSGDTPIKDQAVSAKAAEPKVIIKTVEVPKTTDNTDETPTITLQANEWLDPATSDLWLIGNTGKWDDAVSSCMGGYRLPTISELKAAANRGLFMVSQSLGGVNKGWTSEEPFPTDLTYASYVNVSGGVVIGSPLPKASTTGIFCIAD